MKRTLLVFGLFLFFFGPSLASANTTALSSDPSYANQPFSFYCDPYNSSFESKKHYLPHDGSCTFSVPTGIVGRTYIAVYKGTPGNATFIAGDLVLAFTPPTLVQEDSVTFGTPAQDQNFFSVVYGSDSIPDGQSFDAYLRTGTTTNPNPILTTNNYRIVEWKWGSKPPSEYDPVIIIPGILGSWEHSPLVSIPGLAPQEDWVIDPLLHSYDNLIDTFLANGYVKNKTLFTFGYNWEEPNEATASLLASEIQKIKQTCGCGKVDIVAHSMGGLVSLYYAEHNDYKNNLDQLILVASPVWGAPKAYKTWEGGDVDFGDPRTNLLLKTKFYLEARKSGYSNIFDYIRNRPIESIHELLPTDGYLIDSLGTILPTPTNGFLADLQQNISALQGLRIKQITANNTLNNTVNSFEVASSTQAGKWEHGQPIQTYLGSGDGTVPATTQYFDADPREFSGTDHVGVVNTATSYIFEQLNGAAPATVINKTYSTVRSFLYFKLFSPVDMQIVAPDGKKLGKDFATHTELNEIPDSFYSGFGSDNEYAVILNPVPGNYRITTVGTDNGGPYTMVAIYSDEATTTTAEVAGTTTPAQIIDHIFALPASSTAITLSIVTPPPPPLAPSTPTSTSTSTPPKPHKPPKIPKPGGQCLLKKD